MVCATVELLEQGQRTKERPEGIAMYRKRRASNMNLIEHAVFKTEEEGKRIRA